MATAVGIDLDALLAPISDASPAGEDLAYAPEYDDLREARRSEDDANQGDWKRKAKVANWDRVIALATDILTRRSKDLQVAAWLAEALAHRRGFAGLAEGFTLLKGLQDAFWETYYPQVEDGDLEMRYGPFLFINRNFPLLIRSLPLTDDPDKARYSFLRWQESRAARRPAGDDDAPPDERLTAEEFDDAVNKTRRAFYETLAADVGAALEAYREFDRSSDAHFGREAPGMTEVGRALEEVEQLAGRLLDAKREQEPSPDDEPAEDAPEPRADAETDPEPAAEAEPVARKPKPAARTASGPIADADDALRRILEAAAYLRKEAPGDPAGYLVGRAARMAELYRMADLSGLHDAASPSSDDRRDLRRKAAEGDHAALLEAAEAALARPEGMAWLDPHRHAVAALDALGDRPGGSSAAKGWLRAILADFPGLADASLGDGTAAADAETRAWLLAEFAPAPAPAPPEPEAPAPAVFEARPEPDAEAGEPDAFDRARSLADEGRADEGIGLLRDALGRATHGRERFVRSLQLAELCLAARRPDVALHLADDLAAQVDERRLDGWEDPALVARAWSGLCLALRDARAAEAAPARWKAAFARLCRADVARALSIGEGGPPS
ncbi:type VI secretion system protein TssA [Tundrisphaera sp. TA3]|uniref:type VI secretion system protein TssA n=1 Tax=Tundrisphaera sp. TA3 TaxID=3435775 RepID=UPI003EB9F927